MRAGDKDGLTGSDFIPSQFQPIPDCPGMKNCQSGSMPALDYFTAGPRPSDIRPNRDKKA